MRARTENPVLSHPWLWSIVRLRLRKVRPRKSPRSGTGPWHRAGKLVKSLAMGSPSQDRDAGSNPAGATNVVGQQATIWDLLLAEPIAAPPRLAERLTRHSAAVEHALQESPSIRPALLERRPEFS